MTTTIGKAINVKTAKISMISVVPIPNILRFQRINQTIYLFFGIGFRHAN
jgi:hypothetical protein